MMAELTKSYEEKLTEAKKTAKKATDAKLTLTKDLNSREQHMFNLETQIDRQDQDLKRLENQRGEYETKKIIELKEQIQSISFELEH